ncbi:MAG: low molecular weight protein arginine phosphatase [Chitinophagales bacterium]
MSKLVFVCSGNTCRSPMAKGILLKLFTERFPHLLNDLDVFTAGLYAYNGEPASENAQTVMQEIGIDITSHKSMQVNAEMLQNADWIVTMTDGHRRNLCSMFPELDSKITTMYELAGLGSQDVTDPFGGDLNIYRECRKEITSLLNRIVQALNTR